MKESNTLGGIALAIDLLVLIVKLTVGVTFHSTAFVADALRSIYVIASRVMVLWSARMVRRPASHKYSFGWLRVEIVTVTLSAALLVGLSIAIVIDAISQFINLEPMMHPLAIFATGASCLTLGLASRVLTASIVQVRSSTRAAIANKGSASDNTRPSGSRRKRDGLPRDESGGIRNQEPPSPVILAPKCNNENMAESKVTIGRPDALRGKCSLTQLKGKLFRLAGYSGYWRLSIGAALTTMWRKFTSADLKAAMSLRSRTVSLWDSSNVLGDTSITLAALLVWKVPLSGVQYLDPALAMCIAFLSMYFACRLVVAAFPALLLATPLGVDAEAIRKEIGSLPGVISAHHVHIFPIDESRYTASMHVQLDFPWDIATPERLMLLRNQIRRVLHAYSVHSATIEHHFCLDKAHLHVSNCTDGRRELGSAEEV
ncbi:cation efflux protein [Podospora didyma]|uniref:Cation efflux protein n=1 Tax=Podospora didyma TaxID=330526 RepID=A0AAE0KAU5_9PEZI|nr:cation efflux protein [Podospora didyma]